MSADARDGDERYEPLPGLLGLPRFLIHKLGPGGRRTLGLVAAVMLVAAVIGAIVLVPRIDQAKHDDLARQRHEAAAILAARRRELLAERRPHVGRAAAMPGDGRAAPRAGLRDLERGRAPRRAALRDLERARAARRAVLRDLEQAITRDARARVHAGTLSPPPPRYASCELVPHTVDPLVQTSRRTGRYRCVAVTSELPRGDRVSGGGVIGHPFRALVDFELGRFTWCKLSGQPGEGSYTRRSLLGVPRACGG